MGNCSKSTFACCRRRILRLNHLLVRFEARPALRAAQCRGMRTPKGSAARRWFSIWNASSKRPKAQLRDIVEQSEASTEELKASNEELQAVNEELRSATEELETSREELQSINEELTTVNQELKSKVDELSHSNSDLHVLMSSTAIATIFLDRDLRIMRYTPPAVDLFSLIPTDIGRPLTDLDAPPDYPEMVRDARRAIGELATVRARSARCGPLVHCAHFAVSNSSDDRIGGAVFTFIDITERRQAEDALRELQAEQAADLAAILRLQELSSRLLSATELPALLKQLLDATVEMQRADFGCVQLYDALARKLDMVAQHGFDPSILQRFASIGIDESTSSGRSIRKPRPNRRARCKRGRKLHADAPVRRRGGVSRGAFNAAVRPK